MADYQPSGDVFLDDQELAVLQRWLAARYRRTAFPEEFESRLRETRLSDRLPRLFGDEGEYIPGIFFDLDNGAEIAHVGRDDPYSLRIVVVYLTNMDPEAAEAAAVTVRGRIQNAFRERCFVDGRWEWIELVDVEVVADTVLTYAQSLRLRPWQGDAVSLRAGPQHPVLER